MPTTLTIRHQGEQNDQPQFVVARLSDGKNAEPVSLTPPDKFTLSNREHSHLASDLRWYLERFLDYPFEPNTHLAQGIQEALKQWGKEAFSNLFKDKARDWYQDARKNNLDQLTLKITSDDPRILAWPWEALYDPEGGITLAHNCRIERQLNELYDPTPLPDNLPTDCINILLVIARPYGDQDVGYHALARPLVELSQQQTIPVRVDVLRPPTFDQLRDTLRQKQGFYHIVHFDGHGGYGHSDDNNQSINPHNYQGPQGKLVFETPEGEPDNIAAEQLTQLLTEHKIPITVLNACQSAKIDEQADDPFASVAAALLRAGIRSVVAMGYNLYVSAAQQFVPAFYRRLFEQGSVAEATRIGRQAMLAHPQRICSRGEHPLQDWLVPVLYQQDAHDLTFTAASQPQPTQSYALPPEAPKQGDYGFIGRDRAIHALERALNRQAQAGLLIHGMAGVGKTTLAQGFLHWLQQTDGLQNNVFWFSFDAIRNAEYIINHMVEKLFGGEALVASQEQKLEALCECFTQHPFILVWDNFESSSGIEGTEVTPLLSEADRSLLKDFLNRLRRGKTKVIITSRSSETWLSTTDCYRLPLGGLKGEECWQYCNAVVSDLGLTLDRSDKTYSDLMEKLDGHPLAMRAVLLRLEHTPAVSLLKKLEQGFSGHTQDESTARIYAALNLLETNFATHYQPVLQLIGLHQRYVDLNSLEHMIKTSETETERTTIEACLGALERAGLMHPVGKGNGIYTMHPALNGYLKQQHPATADMQSAFVDVMGSMADHYAPKQLHEQRGPFYIHGANFHTALSLAMTLNMANYIAALTQSLAVFAQNNRDFESAARLYQNLADHYSQHNNDKGLAGAYHQLGIIAEEHRDFERAEQWYLKSLAIEEKQGNEHGAAQTYHQLGMIAEEQRDFEAAEQWHLKSLTIKEKQGNKHGTAQTYHQLGRIAQEQRDFEAAEQWYLKSLTIKEKQGNEQDAAITYHQLGVIAQSQRDFERAEQWHLKSLATKEKQGNEHGAANSYHHLGMIAQAQRDFEHAQQWYLKSLAIKEKQGNEHGAAITYHQLGIIAQEQRDFKHAQQWYLKSLAISEKQGIEYVAASTYHQLGMIAEEQRDFEHAQQWYLKSLAIKEKQGNEHGAAITYHAIGFLAKLQQHWIVAAQWLIKAIVGYSKCNDSHNAGRPARIYIELLQQSDAQTQDEIKQLWQQSGLEQAIGPLDALIQQLKEAQENKK